MEIPGYTIKREIGSGGMATVYLAVQDLLEREVALKVMAPALAADPAFSKRFLQEARTLASLAHPNIVAVYDVGVTQSQLHYFSMQYLASGDFGVRLKAGISEAELVDVLVGVTQALGYAHHRGFVHRDVAPGNILFDNAGKPVLTDFGIARAVAQTSRITSSGLALGTSHYMSPEQARGGDVDSRSDLYSLGILTYQALVGKPPYEGDDGFAVAYAHVFEAIPRLPATVAHWQPLIDKALAKDPAQRYANVEEFLTALQQVAPHPSNAPLGSTAAALHDLTTEKAVPAANGRSGEGGIAAKAAAPRSSNEITQRGAKIDPKPATPKARPAVKAAPQTARRTGPLLVLGLAALAGASLLGYAAYQYFSVGVGKRPLVSSAPVTAPVVATTQGGRGAPRPITQPDVPPTAATPTSVQPLAEPTPEASFATPESTATEPTTLDPAALNIDPVTGLPIEPAELDPNAPIDLASIPTVVDPVAKLIGMARYDITRDRLSQPPGGNALDRFLLALKIDPKEAQAKAGVIEVGRKYLEKARKEEAAGNLPEVTRQLERAMFVGMALPEAKVVADEATALRKRITDKLLADGAAAEKIWDKKAAQASYQRLLSFDVANAEAAKGLKRVERIGEPGFAFRDSLKDGKGGPEMVVVGARVAFAKTETTVAEFRRYWSAKGSAQFSGEAHSCRDRESLFRSSRKRTWQSPDIGQDGNHPVVCVSWDQAASYAKWLSDETGKRYRLPSGAEWQSSVRAAASCRANLADEGRGCNDGFAETAPVARFDALSGGVYDMDGNVREWVAQCGNGSAAALGSACKDHIARGRAWLSEENKEKADASDSFSADVGLNSVGFRVVREL